ncbi:hypothetical protein GQ600_8344 [Phytophthora cactorum]|nr:hypothetical protein GQ600_8344 [Phytophthora cactorum]
MKATSEKGADVSAGYTKARLAQLENMLQELRRCEEQKRQQSVESASVVVKQKLLNDQLLQIQDELAAAQTSKAKLCEEIGTLKQAKEHQAKQLSKYKIDLQAARESHAAMTKKMGELETSTWTIKQQYIRYTGCDASFMVRCVRVVKQGIAAWEVCVDPNTEISTHNHDTSKIIYDSYRGAKSMSIPAQVRRELGLLTDMKTSTSDINRYLSKELDIVLTPQQTRNILQQILGSTTLERTKTILDAFADGDVGNDVLFVQDQMDITQSRCNDRHGDRDSCD